MNSILNSYFWENGKMCLSAKYMPASMIRCAHKLPSSPQTSGAQVTRLAKDQVTLPTGVTELHEVRVQNS